MFKYVLKTYSLSIKVTGFGINNSGVQELPLQIIILVMARWPQKENIYFHSSSQPPDSTKGRKRKTQKTRERRKKASTKRIEATALDSSSGVQIQSLRAADLHVLDVSLP